MEPKAPAAAANPKPNPSNPKPRRRKPCADLTNLPSAAAAAADVDPGCGASPAATDAATPRPKDLSGFEEHISEKPVISTVYSRRKIQRRKCTGKVGLSGAASCPPISKIRRTRTSLAQEPEPISSSVPSKKAKKKRHAKMDDSSSKKPTLPEDFVKQQRAYFAEVDAFELQEEEASASDLE